MAKTDKEITSEIVCEFIRAWGTQDNCVPIKMDVRTSRTNKENLQHSSFFRKI